MKNNLFAIHGYNGVTPIIKEYIEPESRKLGIEPYIPVFPKELEASYNKWEQILDTYNEKGLINEDTIIIAHSLGTLFVPKYLVKKDIHIKLYISMAGFLRGNTEREDIKQVAADFLPTEAEIDEAIGLMQNRFAIYSDNDHLFTKEILEEYADRFNAVKRFIPNIGHMGRKSGLTELPEIFEIIKSII